MSILNKHDRHGRAFGAAAIQIALADLNGDRRGVIRGLEKARRAINAILRAETKRPRK